MIVDTLGRAIHKAKRVGGPWGPACGRPITVMVMGVEEPEWETVEYDDNSTEEFACECKAMAQHLLEEIVKL